MDNHQNQEKGPYTLEKISNNMSDNEGKVWKKIDKIDRNK